MQNACDCQLKMLKGKLIYKGNIVLRNAIKHSNALKYPLSMSAPLKSSLLNSTFDSALILSLFWAGGGGGEHYYIYVNNKSLFIINQSSRTKLSRRWLLISLCCLIEYLLWLAPKVWLQRLQRYTYKLIVFISSVHKQCNYTSCKKCTNDCRTFLPITISAHDKLGP